MWGGGGGGGGGVQPKPAGLLAWLFLKKTSRYCHSPGFGGGSDGVISVVRKL